MDSCITSWHSYKLWPNGTCQISLFFSFDISFFFHMFYILLNFLMFFFLMGVIFFFHFFILPLFLLSTKCKLIAICSEVCFNIRWLFSLNSSFVWFSFMCCYSYCFQLIVVFHETGKKDQPWIIYFNYDLVFTPVLFCMQISLLIDI